MNKQSRRNLSNQMKKSWANPEIRARRLAGMRKRTVETFSAVDKLNGKEIGNAFDDAMNYMKGSNKGYLLVDVTTKQFGFLDKKTFEVLRAMGFGMAKL